MDIFVTLLSRQGKIDEAAPFVHHVLNSPPHTPDQLTKYAFIFHRNDKLNDAEPLYREALDEARAS